MYAASISTMQILKIYGVLKYIANISGLTALARYRSGALFLEGFDHYYTANKLAQPKKNSTDISAVSARFSISASEVFFA